MEQTSTLQRSIIETLAFFDLFDYPLTVMELQRFLWRCETPGLDMLIRAVEQLSAVEYVDGLISLRGRGKQLRAWRAERYLESQYKYRRRMKYIRWISYLPGVRAIFVVNSLANQNAQTESDIDVLIVAQRNKIWSTRLFTAGLAKLLGIRPRPKRRQDSLCLSFYIDESALEMRALTHGGRYDMFEAYWLRQIMPIYDPWNTRQKIAHANAWVDHLLPNGRLPQPHPERIIYHGLRHSIIKTVLDWLLIEPLWRALQLKILPRRLKELSGPADSAVVVLSPQLLKFHTVDPRGQWQKQWQKATNYCCPFEAVYTGKIR